MKNIKPFKILVSDEEFESLLGETEKNSEGVIRARKLLVESENNHKSKVKFYEYVKSLSDEQLAEIGVDILVYDEEGYVNKDSLLKLVQNLYKGEENLNAIIREVKYEALTRYVNYFLKEA